MANDRVPSARKPETQKKGTDDSHFYIKTIILPRQARDKHRKNSKKDGVFRTSAIQRALRRDSTPNDRADLRRLPLQPLGLTHPVRTLALRIRELLKMGYRRNAQIQIRAAVSVFGFVLRRLAWLHLRKTPL
jgi:hypothetical protein